MKRFKILPIVAFIVGISAAFISHAGDPETTWVYVENGQQVANPQCEFSEDICAQEFFLDANGNPSIPTGREMEGDKL